jgi:hypothetical protein
MSTHVIPVCIYIADSCRQRYRWLFKDSCTTLKTLTKKYSLLSDLDVKWCQLLAVLKCFLLTIVCLNLNKVRYNKMLNYKPTNTIYKQEWFSPITIFIIAYQKELFIGLLFNNYGLLVFDLKNIFQWKQM